MIFLAVFIAPEGFDRVKDRFFKLGKHIHQSGQYPLPSRGDINLYALFVERMMALVKPHGFMGLLTPSGVYADQTVANSLGLSPPVDE